MFRQRTRLAQFTRRQLLARSAAGLATAWVGTSLPEACGAKIANPSAPRPTHHAPRAKQVIMVFLTGGCSHTDSFDPKPELERFAEKDPKWMPSPWKIAQRGESGIATTNLFPELSDRVDDLCLIRSLNGDHNNHTGATLGMHTGSVSVARPSIGAWINYGLGTLNSNLPGHVVLAKEPPYTGSLAWDANFLPANHQGVRIQPGDSPIDNLQSPNLKTQPYELELLAKLNDRHLRRVGGDSQLAARQASFETALGLQQTAPEVFDLSHESSETKRLYGFEHEKTAAFGWQCLTARRLIERGVRFVELFDVGSRDNWDGAHGDIRSHGPLAEAIDRPLAGLLIDLKRRGMLEETLVVWCTEFGRTPFREGKQGRNHHSRAFTCWLAGGGVKGGYVHGATDATGAKVVENACHVHDFHATILHLMGLDHERLTYRHNGRDFRLTDVAGRVAREVFA